jgi:threonine synthase
VTLGVTRKLLSQGKLNREENLVVCITGNGLKTQEALVEHLPKPKIIGTSFKEFEEMMKSQ